MDANHRILLLLLLGAVASVNRLPVLSAETGRDGEAHALVGMLEQRTYKIGGKEFDIQDARRHKKIPMRVLYPLGAGPFPVIIFSHGVAASHQGYAYLTSCWVRHGFVCLQPAHADSIKLMLEQGKDYKALLNLQHVVGDKQAWIDRAGDISFLIDRLADILPELKGKIDRSRIGLAGHSYGAFTTMLLCGARVPLPESKPRSASLKDPRIKAAIAISPPGIRKNSSALGFSDAHSFTIDVPMLFLTGDRDMPTGNSQERPQEAFQYCNPGDKYFVSINGADHLTFIGTDSRRQEAFGIAHSAHQFLSGSDFAEGYGDQGRHRRLIQETTLLFWDAYLRDDDWAKKILKKEGFSQLVGKAAQTSQK